MNESQLDELRATLHRETQHIHPVGAGAGAVRRRGVRRRHRGRAVVAVGAATCVAGLGVTIAERGGTPQSLAVGAASGGASTPTLAFRVVDGTVAGPSSHFTTAAGVTYELSTAPGVAAAGAQPIEAIYSTSDGEHFTNVEPDAPVSDLTEAGGVLYAVSTAPGAAADSAQYRIATSTDGGAAWSATDLPFDLSTPHATVPISRSSSVVIARGADQTVAELTEYFSPDIDSLVTAAAGGRAHVSTRMTADGYEVVDMSACVATGVATGIAAGKATAAAMGKARAAAECKDAPVIGTISWSQLGLSGPGDLMHQEMLVSSDGTHWDTVAAPSTGPVENLVATDNGYLLLAESADPTGVAPPTTATTLLHSTDARTWTPVSTPAGLNAQAISGNDVVGTDTSGAIETSTDGGSTWSSTDVASLLPAGTQFSVSSADAGPLGFAVLVTPDSPDSPDAPSANGDYLLNSTDGVNWKTTSLGSVGEPASSYPTEVIVGADHVSVDFTGATAASGAMHITTLLGTPER